MTPPVIPVLTQFVSMTKALSSQVNANFAALLNYLVAVQLWNINASNLTTGTISNSVLNSDVTLQGNIFNGNNQLLQLDSNAYIPSANLPTVDYAISVYDATKAYQEGQLVVLKGGTQIYEALLNSIIFTGTIVSGQNIITGISSIAGLNVGMIIPSTAGIPDNSIIESINSSTQITISNNATASTTGLSITATGSVGNALTNTTYWAKGIDLVGSATFPNYTNMTAIAYNTVVQAPSDGWINLYWAYGTSENYSTALFVGSTSTPTIPVPSGMIGLYGATQVDTSGYSLVPIASGTYYKITCNSVPAVQSMWIPAIG